VKKATITKQSPDGLRFAQKVSGSPYGSMGNSRSCFLCGKHRPPGQLMSKRVLGRVERFCAPSCGGLE
jgi:hypothetical protein